ncbi:hypothetical protein CFP56_037737 [Quercus suber]|uniref:Uncharacterized protein n=1 Tax=Quercus suber TaxID=58331 RepID=A0AAW0LPF7_QUESU
MRLRHMNLSLEVDHENYYSFGKQVLRLFAVTTVVKEDADVFALQLSPGRPNCPIELREYLLLSNSSPQIFCKCRVDPSSDLESISYCRNLQVTGD